MELIDKDAIIAKIEKLEELYCYDDKTNAGLVAKAVFNSINNVINTLEVKEVCMSALDNGNMPVERWKEACKAASCQANYRESKGLTENRDDYFVDGVQWADEHPIKMKEVDLEKAIDDYIYTHNGRKRLALELDWKCCNLTLKGGDEIIKFAKHFFELGLKAQKEEEV